MPGTRPGMTEKLTLARRRHRPAKPQFEFHADTVKALADPAIKSRLEQLGVVIVGSSPEELGAHLKREMDKWGVIIKEAGIKGEG